MYLPYIAVRHIVDSGQLDVRLLALQGEDLLNLLDGQLALTAALVGACSAVLDPIAAILDRRLPNDVLRVHATPVAIAAVVPGVMGRRRSRAMYRLAHPAVRLERIAIVAKHPVPVTVC